MRITLIGVVVLAACGNGGNHHPRNFDRSENHGPAANNQDETCTSCHGQDLTGGDGPSCDSCHVEGWRDDCTYCHGGDEDLTGAPPRYAVTTEQTTDFRVHSAHIADTEWHDGFACETCHVMPEDVLSEGHLFVGDRSPGKAEWVFTDSLSPAMTFDGAGTCSDSYCHGTQQEDNGTVAHTDAVDSCDSCHASADSTASVVRNDMSHGHSEHLREGTTCEDCHGDVTTDGESIADASLHVNGTVDLAMPSGVTRTASGTCSGDCHRESHNNERW